MRLVAVRLVGVDNDVRALSLELQRLGFLVQVGADDLGAVGATLDLAELDLAPGVSEPVDQSVSNGRGLDLSGADACRLGS